MVAFHRLYELSIHSFTYDLIYNQLLRQIFRPFKQVMNDPIIRNYK
jgi:hypothetical protein